ncbi:hypothetical protein HYPDE_23068 [Hyphomicrobium denitrificans 1NES1]|uniref:Uncharacterized protein n=1 Tax=Hyphomicrobium denitrificans 1NES1 TaxID=670307 RepID=N0B8B2_9HYPH|nr:hypothetical protein HYPDE_23068 [Hyphomicrobium denitrificans 1NES1]
MIFFDPKLPERSVDAHHKVGVAAIDSEKLDDGIKEPRVFILELTETFGDGEKAVPGKSGGEVGSVMERDRHDFALQ